MKFLRLKKANLIDVTITFDNGDVIETNVSGNQTDDQIKEYYRVGKTFNLGDGEKDKLAKVVDIKIDRSMEKQSADYYKFRNDLPEYQSSDIKVGQEVWFDIDEVTDNENNLDIVKEIEDHGIVKEIKKWPYGNREYYMVEVNDGIIVEVGTVYDSEEKRDLAKNRSFSEKYEPISKASAIQYPHHNSNHWWLLKDREITRKDGEAFKRAVEDVLNDQRSFDLLDRKIVTREDGELFKKVIDYAIKEGYSYDLLWQKFVTRQDKELFDKVVKQAIKDHWGNELIKDKIITEEELELYKNKDNKIEAAIQQPNKPKPTTTLPDNMEWSWDPNAADWVAVMKNNTNVTPPLYNPQNQNLVNQNTTSYMSNIKSASCLSEFLDGPRYSKEIKIEAGLIKNGLVKYAGFDFNRGTKYAITTKGLELLRKASEAEHNEALNEREKLAYMFGFNTDDVSTLDTTGKVIKSEEITDEQLEESWNKYYPLYRKDIEEEKMTEENYPADDEVAQKLKTTLSMYLRGLKRYRKAIPIMKYHTNAKMKRAVEDGHSKGLSEDEITKQVDDIAEEYYKKENKIKPTFNSLSEDHLKSFLFGIIKNKKSASLNKFAKKYTICEADGCELGKVTASSELDAKVKFGIEHPEYADSQSIKAVCADLHNAGAFEYNDYKIDLFRDTDGSATFVIYAPEWQTVNHEKMYKGTASNMDEAITKAYNIIDESKVITSQYEQTTNSHEPYPNPSETPVTDTVIENHTGWVNTADQKVTPQFAKLHNLLSKYSREELIEVSDLDENLVVTGDPQLINQLEHEVKDIGYHCEAVDESLGGDYAPTYSLKIFMK